MTNYMLFGKQPIGGHSESMYHQFHLCLDPLPLYALYVSEVPLPLRVHTSNLSSLPKHLNILFISVGSKFATFSTYLIPLKITTYLCKNN